ncbi:MAG: hypothetical protein ABR974_12000 [Bacteroidales bacterium]|jgi:hypothetical protein
MKKLSLFIASFLFSLATFCQGLIGMPTSLIIVYNYPGNYFYIRLEGTDKRKTDQSTVFLLDNRPVQVLAINKNTFLTDTIKHSSPEEIIKTYIKWESDYIKKTFNFDISNKTEALKTVTGADVVFWAYDMPDQKPVEKADSAVTASTQKQMFVLRLVKDYVIGINMPLFDADQYENNKAYLLRNIDNIVISLKEIDLEELNRQLNKQ